MKVKNKEGIIDLQAKKVSLSCGRWIVKIIPEVGKFMKDIPQIVSYWEMKDP